MTFVTLTPTVGPQQQRRCNIKKPIYTDKEQIFDTDLGQKVNVMRTHLDETKDDRAIAESMNGILKGIGGELAPVKEASYMGSMAVHVYETEMTRQLFYVIQNCKGGMPEIVASRAFEDLRGAVMKSYGRNRPKKRSGM